jgi:RNA polymerase sigma-70 factor (ECF subfamily)
LTDQGQITNDNKLAAEAAEGSKDAFGELVRRFSPRLRCFLSKRVPNPSDVEDIIQDTFLKAYLNIASFDQDYKFSCWLFTIASRTAMNNCRDRKIRATDIQFDIVSQIATPDELLIESEDKENLWKLARELEEKQYSALYLKYGEEFTTEEIAKTMKTTRMNVRVLLHRARGNLIKKAQNDTRK